MSSPDPEADHRLLEQVRGVNKTLSLYVMALQEDPARISGATEQAIIGSLYGLGDAIRARQGLPGLPAATTTVLDAEDDSGSREATVVE